MIMFKYRSIRSKNLGLMPMSMKLTTLISETKSHKFTKLREAHHHDMICLQTIMQRYNRKGRYCRTIVLRKNSKVIS